MLRGSPVPARKRAGLHPARSPDSWKDVVEHGVNIAYGINPIVAEDRKRPQIPSF
jgi:hypothetical protein